MNRKITAAILILTFLAGTLSAMGRKKSKEEADLKKDTVRVRGVVGFTPIEGGCWHITGRINNSGDAERFELAGVAKNRLAELRGKIAGAEGVIREDTASVCQIGRILEVKKIALAEHPTNINGPAGENADSGSAIEGSFTYFEGDVSVKKPESEEWEQVTGETILTEGSEIKLESGAYATVNIDSKKEANLNESTHLKYDRSDSGDEIDVYYGSIKAKVGELSGEEMKIRTPQAVAAVRGTEFAVIYEEEASSEVEVYDGKVGVASRKTDTPEKEIVLSSNRWAEVRGGRKPEEKGKIPEIRKLRWNHLEIKRNLFRNLRKLKRMRMLENRLKAKKKAAKDKSVKERIDKLLKRTAQNRIEAAETVKTEKDKLKKIAAGYKKLRKKNADKRLELINKKRKEIIERRLRKRKERLQERRRRR
ncbi:MAG: FecR family protein [Elusimicrobiota bacterium]|nr:FecR family protein [Elusimicrobiota bacterium]